MGSEMCIRDRYCYYLNDYLKSKEFRAADLIYMKAIEHVPLWEEMAHEISRSLSDKGILMIKHRPFYSDLGPHRYATTGIPWGHCLLSDEE